MAASLASQASTNPLGAREKTTPETSKRGSDNLTPQNNAAKEARTEPATPGSDSKTPTLPAKKFFNRVKKYTIDDVKEIKCGVQANLERQFNAIERGPDPKIAFQINSLDYEIQLEVMGIEKKEAFADIIKEAFQNKSYKEAESIVKTKESLLKIREELIIGARLKCGQNDQEARTFYNSLKEKIEKVNSIWTPPPLPEQKNQYNIVAYSVADALVNQTIRCAFHVNTEELNSKIQCLTVETEKLQGNSKLASRQIEFISNQQNKMASSLVEQKQTDADRKLKIRDSNELYNIALVNGKNLIDTNRQLAKQVKHSLLKKWEENSFRVPDIEVFSFGQSAKKDRIFLVIFSSASEARRFEGEAKDLRLKNKTNFKTNRFDASSSEGAPIPNWKDIKIGLVNQYKQAITQYLSNNPNKKFYMDKGDSIFISQKYIKNPSFKLYWEFTCPITGNLHLYNGVDNPFSYIKEILKRTIDNPQVIIE